MRFAVGLLERPHSLKWTTLWEQTGNESDVSL
jgi:hypothetical protein